LIISDPAIQIINVGKKYLLFRKPRDKLLHIFGLNKIIPITTSQYKEFWALRQINLSIHKGERVGIIGRNGAGKSTLLKIISGNIEPSEGSVKVQGRINALMEIGTGFHPEFTGRENIRASLSYQNIDPREIRILEDEIIEFSELEDFIDQPLKTYSAGMYTRLAFTVATVIKPEILIIDEIMGAGDAYFNGKCIERMKKLTSNGATVLFVSHDLSSVQMLCERVIWIERGSIMMDGNPLHVVKAYSETVRKENDLRLRARDLKIRKKEIARMDLNKDLYLMRLFHIINPSLGDILGICRFYTLRLFIGEELIGSIELGKPMDNAPDAPHRILDDPGFMCWGPPKKDPLYGMYRDYDDRSGKFRHAPFIFSIPASYCSSMAPARLELIYESQAEMSLEIYIDNAYVPVGTLPMQSRGTYILELGNIFLDKAEDSISPPRKRAPSP